MTGALTDPNRSHDETGDNEDDVDTGRPDTEFPQKMVSDDEQSCNGAKRLYGSEVLHLLLRLRGLKRVFQVHQSAADAL